MRIEPCGKSEITPDSRFYRPRGAALDLLYCRAPEVLVEGPAGTGKTRAVLEKAHLVARKYKGARILFARKTRSSLSQTALQIFEDAVVERGSPILHGAARSNRSSYRYPNGSEIVLGGLDNVERIMSAEYDMVCVFEATEVAQDEWEKLQTRLRHGALYELHDSRPWHQIIGECNPQAPTHWLNVRASTPGRMVRLVSRHEDNPACTAEYIELLSQLTGVRRERLYFGRWAAAEGLVYDGFDRTLHVVPADIIGDSWRRIISIDFGYHSPFVAQWWAMDGDGRLYMYREIYMTERLVSEHAETIRRFVEDERVEAIVADHEDREGRETLHAVGLRTIPAEKAVLPGIQSVTSRLQIARDRRPRIFFVADCVVEYDQKLRKSGRPCSTLEEFDCYTWARASDGSIRKEAPQKENDHGMDAMRYAVRYFDGDKRLRVKVIAPGK